MLIYIIDEHNRDVDLLENKNILLLLLTHTKLQDWIAFNVSHKYDWLQKLIIDNDEINVSENHINHKKDLNSSKKSEKSMLALFCKWEHFRKYFLLINNFKRKLINMQQTVSLFVDDLYNHECIAEKLKWSAKL